MRTALLAGLLCCAAAWTLRAAAPADGAPPDPREQAKREAWSFAVLVASVLAHGDQSATPALREWLDEFRRIEAKVPARASARPFPKLDADALVTRNPRFWQAFYEVAPGDPGFALLHAALLLCGGEAQRATVIATLGFQRGSVPEEFRRGLETVIAGARAAQARSFAFVRQGVILHDVREYSGALRRYDAALAEWPANGLAWYERGSTLRLQAIADGARLRPVTGGIVDEEPVSDPPATREAFALARRHDPFCLLAYQGEDSAALRGLMALVRTGLPVWEGMRKRPEAPATREELRNLADACRDAGIEEYALVARQFFIARNRHYNAEDLEFIGDCLGRLASAAAADVALTRLGNDPLRRARSIAAPEPAGEIADAAVGGESLIAAQMAAEIGRRAKAAASEKKPASKPPVRSKTTKKRKRG